MIYGHTDFANTERPVCEAANLASMPKSSTLAEEVSELNCALNLIHERVFVINRSLFGDDIGCDCTEKPCVDCMSRSVRDSLMIAKAVGIALDNIIERMGGVR